MTGNDKEFTETKYQLGDECKGDAPQSQYQFSVVSLKEEPLDETTAICKSELNIDDNIDKADEISTNNETEITKESEIYAKRLKSEENSMRNVISDYNRKEIIKSLETNGWTDENFQFSVRRFCISRELALKYFNEHISLAEEYVHQECNSLVFQTLTNFLDAAKKSHLSEINSIEQAAIVELIAESERYPDPKDMDGIDIKSIYHFISNALLGNPQQGLNQQSEKLLCLTLKSLIEESNSSEYDKAVESMLENILEPMDDLPAGEDQLKLNPMLLEDEGSNPKKH